MDPGYTLQLKPIVSICCSNRRRNERHTVEGLDHRQEPFPSQVLAVDVAEVSYKKRFLCVGFAIIGHLISSHNAAPKMNLWVSVVHRRKSKKHEIFCGFSRVCRRRHDGVRKGGIVEGGSRQGGRTRG